MKWLRVLKVSLVLLVIAVSIFAAPILNRHFAGANAASLGNDVSADVSEDTESNTSSEQKSLLQSEDRKDLSSCQSIGTIFIGDSRFVGMDTACNIDGHNDEYVVAETGKGLPWLKSTGIRQARALRRKYRKYDAWRYVICLGVNDLWDADDYVKYYKSLDEADMDNIEIVLVSVNPVKSYPNITSDDIEDFNDTIANAGFYYIDTYTVLDEEGFTTTDGLHYDNKTYKKIYNTIEEELK